MSQKMPQDTILAVGYGLLPSNTASGQLYHVLTMAAEIDRETHHILDASITLITKTAGRWVSQSMVGYDLTSEDDTASFMQRVDRDFLGNSRKAIQHAYRDMVQRYLEYLGQSAVAPPENPPLNP
ncbi:MAG: DUF3870 domain-containing protein [Thermoleophilia bacterium]|nr:DUF3870 domain-containing protein [Thermoleophilia bacterium]